MGVSPLALEAVEATVSFSDEDFRLELLRERAILRAHDQPKSKPTPTHSESRTDTANPQLNGKVNIPLSPPRLATYTAEELRGKALPALKEIVPELLYEGVNVLASPPKTGKGWLALNISLAAAAGGKALSRIDLEQGDVLLLALEDSERRLQDRIDTLLGENDPWPERLHITHHAPQDGQGLTEAVTEWLTNHPQARLVVIDTLGRVRPSKKRGADSYQEDYQTTSRLQRLALDHHIAILLVHHTKKAGEDDFLAQVSGTFGLTGAADAVLVLKRARSNAGAVLSVTGRDIEERELALAFNDGLWQLIGDAADVKRSEARTAILTALQRAKPHGLKAKHVAAITGRNYHTVKNLLRKMFLAGEVKSDEKGNYYRS
jgi:hypothetical protein